MANRHVDLEVYLGPDLKRWLTEHCAATDDKMSAYIRRLIRADQHRMATEPQGTHRRTQ